MMELKKTVLGIELGSTRIKAVLIDDRHLPIASGDFEWENQLVDGIWTYSMDMVHTGLQSCFARLREDVKARFGQELTTVGAIGVSAMMHGYLPFDKDGKQLAEFRTWRNTITGEAAEKLTALFGFNIPQRWSIAHLYQAILNGEEHVKDIAFLTTLAGYIHWRLSGEKLMGVGEASGMFPIDSAKLDYDEGMLRKFDALTGMDLRAILPRVLPAGAQAGTLTEAGAPDAIPCKLEVNEMMGSELHLHVFTEDETRLIVRVPTINLTAEQRKGMVYGQKLYITFEGKVMHFFDKETQKNLIYG